MKNDKSIPPELAEYLRDLVAAIYTASPADWKQRISECPGERSDVDRELLKRVEADRVRQTLFRNKNDSKEIRRKLFSGLVRFARSHDLAPPPTILKTATVTNADETYENSPYYAVVPRYKIRDVLAENVPWPTETAKIDEMVQRLEECEDMTLHTVRWAVEVRQRQIAENKKRIIPQSLRQKREQADDSIQFKRKFRA